MLRLCSSIFRRSAAIGRARSTRCISTTSASRGGVRWNPTLMVAAGIAAIGGSGLGIWLLPSPSFAESNSPQINDSGAQEKRPKYLIGDSYRKRVFFNYEKRIRLRSPPEKIFEYFASFRSSEGEVFMYPADLMRAVVPVFPPSESNLVRDGHLRGEQHPGDLNCAPSKFFMLFDTNNDGLISFSEYIFFITLLSIPESSFSVAFKMFDLDHNGEIDREEFKKVMALMRSYNRQGTSHRDGLRIGLKVGTPVENGGLLEYFFGKDGNGRLQHDKFVQFLRDLHEEIVHLEFQHYDYHSSGTISSVDFALSMVASADINHVSKFLDRVDELNSNVLLKEMRISFEEFKAFAELRKKLQPLALAIFCFGKVNGLLTKQDFQRAASHVCGISVTDNVVDIIFHIFDANRDGSLSAEEFLTALQRRETDIRQPSATGVMSLFSCCLNCAKTCTVSQVPI
ncbi:calcium uptake protein, mitochondrial-like [Dioscorea cayenensis subsp. rotundata]|uniref:Calcium uptake protein, mitochondrial-like n=1 Tax=Dioscorea cayennensis subsp. rotundata TaxID=55577 RepID=A0AB40CTQ7_DIOCR|nr:calcium uptake protein, mitochondrial-like [Dioscorea cayenensis subsp. rotundata]